MSGPQIAGSLRSLTLHGRWPNGTCILKSPPPSVSLSVPIPFAARMEVWTPRWDPRGPQFPVSTRECPPLYYSCRGLRHHYCSPWLDVSYQAKLVSTQNWSRMIMWCLEGKGYKIWQEGGKTEKEKWSTETEVCDVKSMMSNKQQTKSPHDLSPW